MKIDIDMGYHAGSEISLNEILVFMEKYDRNNPYRHLILALSEGKEIEFNSCDRWSIIDSPSFDYPAESYRVKESPKYIPWNQETKPKSYRIVIRNKVTNTYQIATLDENYVKADFESLLNENEWATDVNETNWKVCGTLV